MQGEIETEHDRRGGGRMQRRVEVSDDGKRKMRR